MNSSGYLIPERTGHWYDTKGNPAYEVPNASKPGLMRPTTLADAKKLGLLPSVTSIMQVLHKPALESWKAQQYILSALTLPQESHESADEFARRVVRDAQSESGKAADFGTNVHALAEMWICGTLPDTVDSISLPFLQGFMEWSSQHDLVPVSLELSFANLAHGYGGRIDFEGYIDGVYCVADWKTQGTKPGKPFNFYPDWGVQLAAYSEGICKGRDLPGVSVAISSTEPGRVESMLWLGDWRWRVFEACKELWYSPVGPGNGLRQLT